MINTQESGRHKLGLLAFPPAHPHHKYHHAITAGAEVHTIMYTSAKAQIIRMERVGSAVGHAGAAVRRAGAAVGRVGTCTHIPRAVYSVTASLVDCLAFLSFL